jgi:flagellar motor protein MotB
MLQETENTIFEYDDSGYIISISDMMSGLLFIFIITLVAFIINFQDAIQRQEKIREENEITSLNLKRKVKELEQEIIIQKKTRRAYANTVQKIVATETIRKNLLVRLKKELKEQGIKVEIDEKHGVLRLSEKAIRFRTGQAELAEDQLLKLEIIGDTLASILPCYAANPPEHWIKNNLCDPMVEGKLNSVFIEGHTDNVPVDMRTWGRYQNNWELSALRSIYTYQKLIPDRDLLANLINNNNQPIFSVSGYGEGRPIPGHKYDNPTADVENRRIDLRFIMTPPSETEAEKALRDAGVN